MLTFQCPQHVWLEIFSETCNKQYHLKLQNFYTFLESPFGKKNRSLIQPPSPIPGKFFPIHSLAYLPLIQIQINPLEVSQIGLGTNLWNPVPGFQRREKQHADKSHGRISNLYVVWPKDAKIVHQPLTFPERVPSLATSVTNLDLCDQHGFPFP